MRCRFRRLSTRRGITTRFALCRCQQLSWRPLTVRPGVSYLQPMEPRSNISLPLTRAQGRWMADNLDALPMVRRRTAFRESDVDKIWACENGVVLIHNHPMSFQPSFRDVMTAAEHVVVVASVVIGQMDGLVRGSGRPHAGKYADAYNEIKDSLGDSPSRWC